MIKIPLYQYECTECKHSVEKLEFGSEIEQEHICPECGKLMKQLFPDTMKFKLKFNPKKDLVSWGNEGYERSHYWDEVKKQRAEGKDVKPSNEA